MANPASDRRGGDVVTTYAVSYICCKRPSYIAQIELCAAAVEINDPDAQFVILTDRQTKMSRRLRQLDHVRIVRTDVDGLPLMTALVTLQSKFVHRRSRGDDEPLVMLAPDVLVLRPCGFLFDEGFDFAALWRLHSRSSVMNIWFAAGHQDGRAAARAMLSRCVDDLKSMGSDQQEWYGDMTSLQRAFGPYGYLAERPEGTFLLGGFQMALLDINEVAPNPRRGTVRKRYKTPFIHFKGDRTNNMREYFNHYIEPKGKT